MPGPPGTGLETLDLTTIRAISWKHDDVVDVATGLAQLDGIGISLNRSLDTNTQRAQPQVLQVWYESMDTGQPPFAVVAIAGNAKFSPQTIKWATGHTPADTIKLLSNRFARILIRLHCSYLIDQKGKPVSSSAEVIIPTGLPPLPGGVFESWFFIRG